MKTLEPYNDDCFKVHKSAVNKKHKGELKDRLLALEPLIKKEYTDFINNFKKNTLRLQKPSSKLADSKADLLTLYKYQNKVIREVRESIKKQQAKTIISTCQNCTIDSANSLDHILPKSGFPEFIVNPKNLFPCCTTCNSYKLDSVEDDAGQKFLNLYLDQLPKIQYLYVEIFFDENKDLDFKFSLKNVEESISKEFFSILENHYNKLHLFERFKLKSIEYVSEIESKISAFKRSLKVDVIVQHLTIAIVNEKEAYGDNHWKCILEMALINNDLFMERFK